MTALAADKSLAIGCKLDLRDWGAFRQMAAMIRAREIGEVAAIAFGGQHPLNYDSRPKWYFEKGQHGGTLNDIAVHAIDYIRWATGLEFASINAARNWNAALAQAPDFKNAAQAMLTLQNDCGVLGDVSYLSPDGFGYRFPHYWRMTFWDATASWRRASTPARWCCTAAPPASPSASQPVKTALAATLRIFCGR